MKKLKNVKIKKILAFTVALALTMSCMPSAYTISADEIFGDGTEELFTDGTDDSVWGAEEITPDAGSTGQEQQVQQSVLTYENDAVRVTAEAEDEGAIPQSASLRADTVSGNSSVSYDTVSQKLAWMAENRGSSLRGFFAYDVYFVDAGGNRVEPNGRVKITIESKTPAAPKLNDAANTNVTVQKLWYNGNSGEAEAYELQAGGELKVLNVNEYRQLETVQVETGNNAVFAVMWDCAEVSADPEVNGEAGDVGQTEGNSEEAGFTDSEAEVSVPEQQPEEESPVENPDGQKEDQTVENPDGQVEEKEADNPDGQVEEKPAENPDGQVEEKPAENSDGQTEEQSVDNPDGQTDKNQAENPDGTSEEDPEKDPDEVEEENPQDSEDVEKDDSEEEENQDAENETSYIEVIADDVNLHVSPSEDAEVIDAVNSGTKLQLLETVTAEDGTTWYKVSWNETEAYIRSDMAQLVEKEDEEPAEEEVTDMEQEAPVTYTKTVGNVIVTATAESGVIPKDAEFVVTPVEKETSQYSEVASQLESKAENEDYSIAGFLAYDIYFTDSDGQKINPEDGKVKISMEYQKSEAPEEVKETEVATLSLDGTDNADELFQYDDNMDQQTFDIAVMHLVEDENGNVQSVVDMTQDGTASVEANAEGEVQKAEFETESFSVFTITWKKNDSFGTNLIIKYVDEEGNEIDTATAQNELVKPEEENNVIELKKYQYQILNYSYKATKLNSLDGMDAISVRLGSLDENGNWTEERTPQVLVDKDEDGNENVWLDVQKSSVIYMVYSRIPDSPVEDSDLKISRQKYIEKNNNGTYDVTLNVAGTVETQITQAKVDVLLIADVSGSMAEQKLKDTKSAVRALVDTFNEKENVDVNYQLVTFSNGAENVTTSWINNGDDFYNQYVDGLSAAGGTNYQQGLLKAQTPLAGSRDDATKIVIFLTDGEPTFYDDPVKLNKTYPHGRGDSVSEGTLTAALNAALEIKKCDKFYAVGIGLGDLTGKKIYKYDREETDEGYGGEVAYNYNKDNQKVYYTSNEKTENPVYEKYTKGIDILNAVTAQINISANNKEAINLEQSSQLTDKFKQIAGNSLTFACSEVEIEDTLSEYVQPTSSSALNIRVLKKGADGKFEETPIADVTGSAELADTAAEVEGTTITAHYDTELKKVTLTFPKEYELKENYYYYVTITSLEPTAEAYSEYKASGYNAAGDKLTDASEDKNYGVNEGSSSEQPGFYSNSEAKVSYMYKNKEKTVDYAKPVIQVIDSDLVKSKTAKVVSWDDRTYNITLNASSTVKTTSKPKPVEVILVFDRSGSMHFRSKLNPYKVCTTSGLNTGEIYYYMDSDEKATVYRVWAETSNRRTTWYYIDDSYWNYSTGTVSSGHKKNTLTDNSRQYYTDGDPGHDRFYYLKQAATEFTTKLADKSADTKVALIAFSSTATEEMDLTTLTPENVTALNNKITALETSGGTHQNEALDMATGILQNDTSDLQRYVILLTDGCPNGVGYDTVESSVINLKAQKNTTLMTIGVGLKDNAGLQQAKDKLNDWASDAGNGNKYAYNADDGDQLFGVFDSILSSITQKAPVEHAYVKDYIGANFELTEKEKERLLKDSTVEIGTDEKGTYILWKNQTIPAQGSNGSPGWSKTFQVKAKDSYIGGNNVRTNGDGSGITVKDKFLEFEQPTVNVKARMEVGNKEVTIYKGDEFPTEDEILNQLFDRNNSTTSYEGIKADASKVTVKWYKDPECTQEVATDANGNPVYELKQLSETDKYPTAEETKYYIKVTYDAGNPSEESNRNTTTNDGVEHIAGIRNDTANTYIESAVNKEDVGKNDQRTYGIYTIKVISGQIIVTKTLTDRNNQPLTAAEDQTFTFKVTKTKKNEAGESVTDTTFGTEGSMEVTIKVPRGQSTGTLSNDDAEKLTKLSRGTYVVEEINVPQEFRTSGADVVIKSESQADGTDCKYSVSTDNKYKVTFKLGYKMDNNSEDTDVIVKGNDSNGKLCYTYSEADGGRKGLVSYTNKQITADLDLKKTDSKTNDPLSKAKFKLEKWTVSEEEAEGAWIKVQGYEKFEVKNGDSDRELIGLLPGRYKLTEVEAPEKHFLLGESIYFKVEDGNITLTDENGDTDASPSMWELSENGLILTIKNAEIYTLPSSGGPGIYGFTISGVAILATALLLFITNKRREEEAERS